MKTEPAAPARITVGLAGMQTEPDAPARITVGLAGASGSVLGLKHLAAEDGERAAPIGHYVVGMPELHALGGALFEDGDLFRRAGRSVCRKRRQRSFAAPAAKATACKLARTHRIQRADTTLGIAAPAQLARSRRWRVATVQTPFLRHDSLTYDPTHRGL